MRKIIALALVFVFLLSGISYGAPSRWAVPELERAAEKGLVTERVAGDYQKEISREEFAGLILPLYELLSGKKVELEWEDPFIDTRDSGVIKANKLGIVKGVGNKKFAPHTSITREEISVMFYRTIKAVDQFFVDEKYKVKFTDKEEISQWALEAVGFMSEKGILLGSNNKVNPKAPTTREQAIALVLRTYEEFYIKLVIKGTSALDPDTVVYSDGKIYVGDVKGNQPHGSGMMILPDNFKYSGEFKDGEPYGPGVYYDGDEDPVNGQWVDGEFLVELIPPTLRLSSLSSDRIKIQWDPVPGAAYYHIYYSNSKSGPWEYFEDEDGEILAIYESDDNSIELYGLDKGERVYVKMTSLRDARESKDSKVEDIRTPSR